MSDGKIKDMTDHPRPSAEDQKAAFLRKMAHEMRTPLGSMLMLAELLADNAAGRLGEREIGYARKLQRAGTEIRDLLTAVLDLSRIETGAVTVDRAEVSLAELAEGLAQDFQEIAKGKSLALRVAQAGELPRALHTDRLQLTRLLRLLLGHAVSCAAAHVDLRLAVGAGTSVEIAVGHDGPPIAEERRQAALEPFPTGHHGASALALATAKALAELLGGRLELVTESSGGDACVLVLPDRR